MLLTGIVVLMFWLRPVEEPKPPPPNGFIWLPLDPIGHATLPPVCVKRDEDLPDEPRDSS